MKLLEFDRLSKTSARQSVIPGGNCLDGATLPVDAISMWDEFVTVLDERIRFILDVRCESVTVPVHPQDLQIAVGIMIRDAIKNCRLNDNIRMKLRRNLNQVSVVVQSTSDAANELLRSALAYQPTSPHDEAMLNPELSSVAWLAEGIGGAFTVDVIRMDDGREVVSYTLSLPTITETLIWNAA